MTASVARYYPIELRILTRWSYLRHARHQGSLTRLKLQIMYKSDERSRQLDVARLTPFYLSFIIKKLDGK